MYVCMYVCMHACMYVSMHACMYVSMHVCTYACMHVCTYACVHACMHVSHACIGALVIIVASTISGLQGVGLGLRIVRRRPLAKFPRSQASVISTKFKTIHVNDDVYLVTSPL